MLVQTLNEFELEQAHATPSLVPLSLAPAKSRGRDQRGTSGLRERMRGAHDHQETPFCGCDGVHVFV